MKLTRTKLRSMINEELTAMRARDSEALLREAVREVLITEITVGDLRKAMGLLKKKKSIEKAKEAATTMGAYAIGQVLGAMGQSPSSAWQAAAKAGELGMLAWDLYKGVASVDAKKKEKNPVLDAMTIDPQKAAILDDEVEVRFLKALATAVDGLPDSANLPDADVVLSTWLKDEFQGAHITK